MVDPFHVISLANRCLDVVRRRVQTEQLGHRGRRDDPLYRARRVLLIGEEKLDAAVTERLWSLLELGDPGAEVAIPYRIKERLRDFYRTCEPDEALALLEELQCHCLRRAMPPEIQKKFARSHGAPRHGAPGRTRTCDARFRKPTLYPLSYGGLAQITWSRRVLVG